MTPENSAPSPDNLKNLNLNLKNIYKKLNLNLGTSS